MKKNEFIVLGHTGFIGSKVFNQLKSISIPVRGVSSKEINFLDPKSPEKLKPLLKINTTLIIATALTRELGDNLETLEGNLKIIINIDKALERKKIKKCIYLSTTDIYGPVNKNALPITEETKLNPQSYYGIAKLFSEDIIQLVCQKLKIPYLVLRYNGVFGPGQKNIGYGPNFFIESIKKSSTVKIWGDGKELRDTLYVNDLAKIIIELSLGRPVGIYNVAKGESLSFIQILNLIGKVSQKKFRVEKRERSSPKFDQTFNVKKIKKVLPRFNFTPLETAISETCKATFGSI